MWREYSRDGSTSVSYWRSSQKNRSFSICALIMLLYWSCSTRHSASYSSPPPHILTYRSMYVFWISANGFYVSSRSIASPFHPPARAGKPRRVRSSGVASLAGTDSAPPPGESADVALASREVASSPPLEARAFPPPPSWGSPRWSS